MRTYSLQDILSREIEFEDSSCSFSQIQIPIIQRDYAQGRTEQGTVRDRLLDALLSALKVGRILELDFVYGAIKELDSDQLFIPLDGQQRLTTLFLLHWYIGNRELTELPEKLDELRSILSRFSYSTRSTSNRFCERLVETSVSFNDLPSIEIRNSSWFFDVFDLDPTVKSMLNMIDAIHEKYGETELNLFESLDKLKFYILPLNGFDLTDELYVKMNARGKPLTGFENFKADLFKWLKSQENKSTKFSSKIVYHGRNLKYHFVLELKFDIDWTGMFWNFSKSREKQDDKLVDNYFHHFINRYLLNKYILCSTIGFSELESDFVFRALYLADRDGNKFAYKSFDHYESILKLSPEEITVGLEKALDGLKDNLEVINELSQPNWISQEWKIFSTNISQRQRIVFLAITIYLERNSFDSEKFNDWMRVVWNIIIDPNLRSVPAMATAMTYINELSDQSIDILSHLASSKLQLLKNDNSFEIQLAEEYLKARLIKQDDRWKSEIIKAESHTLFQGKINFLLTEQTENDIDLFIQYRETAIDIFEGNDLSDRSENYLWVRALLSKCETFEIDNKGVDLSNGNFSNWRELINGSFCAPMQSLIKDIIESGKPAQKRMVELCSQYIINKHLPWLFPLVNWVGTDGETLLGNYSESRKIKRYGDYIYLFNKNNWTDGNILLETSRNQLVASLLNSYPNLSFSSQWFNIQNKFFRDWNVRMTRVVEGIEFSLDVTREDIYVGVKEIADSNQVFSKLIISEDDKPEGWSFRRKFNFGNYTSQDLSQVIYHLNEAIFNDENVNSLISQLKTKI